MEPTAGIEPANLFLTKEALYRLSYVGSNRRACRFTYLIQKTEYKVERATRFELATSSLEGWSSTS